MVDLPVYFISCHDEKVVGLGYIGAQVPVISRGFPHLIELPNYDVRRLVDVRVSWTLGDEPYARFGNEEPCESVIDFFVVCGRTVPGSMRQIESVDLLRNRYEVSVCLY